MSMVVAEGQGRVGTTRDTGVRRTTARHEGATAPPNAPGGDVVLLGTSVVLLGLGLVLVYSASTAFAAKRFDNAEHFLTYQALYALVGIVLGLWAARRDSAFWADKAPLFFAATSFACLLVLIPGIGRLANGARRWLAIGPFGFQPSELAKIAVVVILALVLARRDRRTTKERPSLLAPVLLVQLPVVLTLAGPDLGTALVLELVAAAMIFAAGLKPKTLLVLGLAALPVLYHLVVGTPFRLQRLLSYIDPWAYRSSVGYQITESLISIGSGGLFGVGLGGGKHKLFFLPEAHTDFIFAILAEELGLVGVLFVLCAFALFVWRGFHIAVHARSPFDSYLAVGLTSIVGVPAVFNVGVATGLLPTKGLPLPLISYGGSNLVVVLIAIGMLLRISRETAGTHGNESHGSER